MRRISESHFDSDNEKYKSHALKLIHRDEQEVSNKFGQNVRNAFPLSDVFISAERKDRAKYQLNRFVELLFCNTFITPSRDEQSMFFAHAAALRSADMNRQVGAAITTAEGEIITIGCNEVPRGGGGLYWAGDKGDSRDFQIGEDISFSIRKHMLAEVFNRLRERGWLEKEKSKDDIENLVSEAITTKGDPDPVLKGSQIMAVLEFGRTVHAEMAAITEAAKRGIGTEGATLYTTTFPCHLCARHIVSSGIRRVVYIEPYPKSKVKELYPDSIALDEKIDGDNVVPFVPFEAFVGVAPGQYNNLFDMVDREENGSIKDWDRRTARPKLERFVPAYIDIENGALELFNKACGTRSIRNFEELEKPA